jgi:hypothetical protein
MAFPVFAPGDVLTAADMNAVSAFVVKPITTFTTVGTINVDNVFSTDYRTYEVLIQTTAVSTTLQILFRMRVSGTDSSASQYFMGMNGPNYAADTTLYGPRSDAATSWAISPNAASTRALRNIRLRFYQAQVATQTILEGRYLEANDAVYYYIGGQHNVSTAYDGFSILTSTGTITGTYSVTGYR